MFHQISLQNMLVLCNAKFEMKVKGSRCQRFSYKCNFSVLSYGSFNLVESSDNGDPCKLDKTIITYLPNDRMTVTSSQHNIFGIDEIPTKKTQIHQ